MNIYDFKVKDQKGNEVSFKQYEGKLLLIVNTATACGFTPQYSGLEALYKKYNGKGFEILDFPCNQFAGQAPENDDEIHAFCTGRFGVTFPQFSKIDVNGETAIPLFKYLVEQKGFEGFGPESEITKMMEGVMKKYQPDYKKTPSIKWNFTKFLVDRNGTVVGRFEPTISPEDMEETIEKYL